MKQVMFISERKIGFPLSKHEKKRFLNLSKFLSGKVIAISENGFKNFKYQNFTFFLIPKIVLPVWALLALIKSLRSNKGEIIIAQSPFLSGVIAGINKKFLKNKIIIEAHGDWIESFFLYKKRRFAKLQMIILKKCSEFSLQSADVIRVVSDYTKKVVKKFVKNKKIIKFAAYTDLDIFLQEQNISFNNILFVGSLYYLKGVQYLIQAFKNIDCNSKLIIVGDGPYRKNLKKLAEKNKKIFFKGHLPLWKVKNEMSKCSMLILPSLSEGTPLVLIEAMACSKPVIASSVGGIPEIVKNGFNGFLIKQGDVKDLSDKISFLLNNPKKIQEMGLNGRGFVKERFSINAYMDNFKRMIDLVEK